VGEGLLFYAAVKLSNMKYRTSQYEVIAELDQDWDIQISLRKKPYENSDVLYSRKITNRVDIDTDTNLIDVIGLDNIKLLSRKINVLMINNFK
jgi:hypothetical protein